MVERRGCDCLPEHVAIEELPSERGAGEVVGLQLLARLREYHVLLQHLPIIQFHGTVSNIPRNVGTRFGRLIGLCCH